MKDENRDFEKENRFYEKYIKPQYTILKRIKRKLFGPPTRKRIKTIDDFDFLDYDLFVKLICILMIYVLLRAVLMGIYDLYRWFFPIKEYIEMQPYFKHIINTINGIA